MEKYLIRQTIMNHFRLKDVGIANLYCLSEDDDIDKLVNDLHKLLSNAAQAAEVKHKIIEVRDKPYFRKMRVESGFMYNFYDTEKDDYQQEWTFVPDALT